MQFEMSRSEIASKKKMEKMHVPVTSGRLREIHVQKLRSDRFAGQFFFLDDCAGR